MTQEQRERMETMLINMTEKLPSITLFADTPQKRYTPEAVQAAAEAAYALVALGESAPKIPVTVHVNHMVGGKPLGEVSPVRGISVEQQEKDKLTCNAAWELLEKAISNSRDHAQEEFDKLPPLVQKVVGSPQYLYQWNTVFDKHSDEIESNFRDAFLEASGREKPRGRLGEITVMLHVDTTELDAALAKAERLADILRKTSGNGGTG